MIIKYPKAHHLIFWVCQSNCYRFYVEDAIAIETSWISSWMIPFQADVMRLNFYCRNGKEDIFFHKSLGVFLFLVVLSLSGYIFLLFAFFNVAIFPQFTLKGLYSSDN